MTAPVHPRSAAPQPTRSQPGKAERGGAQQYAADLGVYNPLKQLVPLRDGNTPDTMDSERINRFGYEYNSQTNVLLVRDRQIEYNVRMLCGQQWNVWHPTLGRFFDVSDWLSNDEKAWRKLPVINKLLNWYVITHARLTENPPVLTVLPGPDRIDAEAAEVLDTLFKKDWRDAGMESVHATIMMWVTIAGRAHALSRLDPSVGEWKPWIAAAHLTVVDDHGVPIPDPQHPGQPLKTPMAIPNVPLNADGSPNAVLHAGTAQVQPLGPPHMERSGGVAVDVYSPLQVRAQWGPQLWHTKRWHALQRFLTPEEVFEAWGIEVEPDISDAAAVNIATLERVLYGSGFYGAAQGRLGTGWTDSSVKGALCTVYERWQAPLPYDERLEGTWAEQMVETPENPGGRHTVWTPTTCILDGPRERAWPFVSPIRCFDFITLPGRPSGTTSLEVLLGPQRSYNQSRSQLMEQAALLGNPQTVIDEDSGIQPNQMTNEPGKIYTAAKRPGVAAVEYIAAPGVSPDVIKAIAFAAQEIDEMGGLRGTEGSAPTDGSSGELVKELRFNADRLLGPTARAAVAEYGRLAEDWRELYKLIYTAQSIIAINGQDNLAETITVIPMMLTDAHVNIVPDVESMLPEGRGERQARAERMWKDGAWGDPLSEDAREIYLEQARFPNYMRMSRPNGIDIDTARQENGKMLTGQLQQPVLPWYDHAAHLRVHERYMKRPEFLKQPQQVQLAFFFHRQQHIIQLQAMIAQQKQQMFEDAAIQAQLTAEAKGATNPAPAPAKGPAGPGPITPQKQAQSTAPRSGAPPQKKPPAPGQQGTRRPARPRSTPGSATESKSPTGMTSPPR